jgi:hypothetical protein
LIFIYLCIHEEPTVWEELLLSFEVCRFTMIDTFIIGIFLWAAGQGVEGLSINIVGGDGQALEVSFFYGDDLGHLASAAVEAAQLDAGEGCRDRMCVAGLLEAAMRARLAAESLGNPMASLGAVDKSYAVYTAQLPAHAAQQAREDAARAAALAARGGKSPNNARSVTSPTGIFASVPCVPPHCDFECAAPRLEPSHLESLAAWASEEVREQLVAKSPTSDSQGHDSQAPSSTRLRTLARLIGSDAGLFGGSAWPPSPRHCLRNGPSGFPVTALIRPVWIAVPEDRIVDCVPRKWSAFANFVTSGSSPEARSYKFSGTAEDELEYHRTYRGALFGVTRKKAGWDCMRHAEILAAGSVPWFIEFAEGVDTNTNPPSNSRDKGIFPPSHVLAHLPVKFLRRYQHLLLRSGAVYATRHVTNSSVAWAVNYTRFDAALHLQVSGVILGYARRRLTTVALAEYLLVSSGHGNLLNSNNTGTPQAVLLTSRLWDYVFLLCSNYLTPCS